MSKINLLTGEAGISINSESATYVFLPGEDLWLQKFIS